MSATMSHDRVNWLRVAKERDEIKAELDQLRAALESTTIAAAQVADRNVELRAELEAHKKTMAELVKISARNIADQLNRDWEQQRNEARAALAEERAMLDWLEAQEVKRGLEITEGRDDPLPFLVLGEDGTTYWGKTYREAIRAAMEDKA